MIGTSIGNYRIERLIGEGGMGQVYLAVHPGIGRRAAVKVLTPGDAEDPEIVSRFITEARAANAIRHPNIVDIYDSGVLEEGTPYIVMEYLEGEPLTERLAREPVSLEDALDWGCQVAEALAAAHASDVVHRDLKPDNLFLVPDPHRLGRMQVKVLDFGIAKLQRRQLEQIHKTRTGMLLGTPLYMSPEQCASHKNIDARTDIYSLGVILYELVTGRRPFDGDGIYAIITMHINDAPTPPSALRPGLPPNVEKIILRAMAKLPEERHPSMAVLHSELELARGNPSASNEALLRAQGLRPIPIEPAQPPASREIRTLGDAAISRQGPRQTLSSRGTRRSKTLLLAGSAVAIASIYWLASRPTSPPAAPHAAHPAPAPAPRPAPPPPPVLPPAPATIEVALASTPGGANVYVGDTLVATTPGTYRATADGAPTEFVFKLPGFEPKRIRAIPSKGLTVRTTFDSNVPAPRPAKAKRRKPKPLESHPSDDIQTER